MKQLAFLIVGLATVGCGNSTKAHFEKVAAELPAAEAAAKKAGVPLHPREVAPPKLKPEDNAAPLLSKAQEVFKKIKLPKGGNIWTLASSTSNADQAQWREILQQVEPGFKLLAQAKLRKGVDLGRDPDYPMGVTFPESTNFKGYAQWSGTRAFTAARDGDTARALDELGTSFAIGEFSGSEASLIAAMVMIAIDQIALRDVERVATIQPKVEVLAELRALLKKHEKRNGLWFYLRGESVSMTSLTKEFSELTGVEESVELVPSGVLPELAGRAYYTRSLQVWTEIATKLNASSDLLTQSKVLPEVAKRLDQNPDLTYEFFKAMSPVYGQFGKSLLKREAQRIAVDALLVCLEFKARQGRFPSTLQEAGVAETDPFTKKPMKMKVEGDSIVIWSVGADLKDDGGQEAKALDQAARYPRK